MSQTLGQKRVKKDYDLTESKLAIAEKIKDKSAELIDLIESLCENEKRQNKAYGEKLRLIDIAQYKIETACMYAVKANFTEE